MNGAVKNGVSEEVYMKALKKTAIIRCVSMLVVLGLIFFLTAWNLMYWEGWVYIFVMGVPIVSFGIYLFKHDPKLLERRMRTKEKQKEHLFYLFRLPLLFLA